VSLYLLYRPRYGPVTQTPPRFRLTTAAKPTPKSDPDDDDVLALFVVARRG
jgi:hypothetical protein